MPELKPDDRIVVEPRQDRALQFILLRSDFVRWGSGRRVARLAPLSHRDRESVGRSEQTRSQSGRTGVTASVPPRSVVQDSGLEPSEAPEALKRFGLILHSIVFPRSSFGPACLLFARPFLAVLH